MAAKWVKRLLLAATLALIAAAFAWALRPQPLGVDIATVGSGPMEVTVDEEGVARIRDVYKISAPIGGRIDRSPLHVGDTLVKGKTVVARIRPADPPFLDERSERELRAAVDAANAAVRLAEAEVARAATELKLARADLERAEELAKTRFISDKALERAIFDVDNRESQWEQANASLNLRRSELESAKARLIQPDDPDIGRLNEHCCITVLAPEDGVVLSVPVESEQVVTAGTVLAESGDPRDLEIVVDLLSSDAVKVEVGAAATIVDWGGGHDLAAVVRRVEPAGFTKVSALGIDEQRVNARLDLTDDPSAYARLGHDFRVYVRIAVWRADDALQVPISALFRNAGEWTVFRVEDGTARLTPVAIGQRNDITAEVREGLSPGVRVILHPSDLLSEGAAVTPRSDSAAPS